jgi:predicted ATPase
MHHAHTNKVFTGGFDNKVMVEGFAALALLPLGYPDQSAERMAAGLTLARELDHPQTAVVAGHMAAQLHQLRGEAPLVQVLAKGAMELAEEYGLSLWVTYGLIELGWAEAELGDAQGGIEKMQRGLADYALTGARLRLPYFLGLLADQLGKSGRVEEGLAAIAAAVTAADNTGERYSISELYRIKGEILLKSGELLRGDVSPPIVSAFAEARACYLEALTIAKQEEMRWWQLRAALSMAHLDTECGRLDLADLMEIYSSLTEGYETAYVKQAKAVLESVRSA